MATLTLRNVKGSSLSHDELDSNFLALDSDISTIQTDLTGAAFWDQVTGGTKIRTDLDVGIGKDPTVAFDVEGAGKFSGNITANVLIGNYLTLDNVNVDATGLELNYNHNTTLGSAVAGKTLVVDASRDIDNLNIVTAVSFTDGTATLSSGNITGGADATFTGSVSANDFAGDGSSITGISVFQLSDVTSGTVVTNLNADKVDGFNGIGIYDSDGTLLNG